MFRCSMTDFSWNRPYLLLLSADIIFFNASTKKINYYDTQNLCFLRNETGIIEILYVYYKYPWKTKRTWMICNLLFEPTAGSRPHLISSLTDGGLCESRCTDIRRVYSARGTVRHSDMKNGKLGNYHILSNSAGSNIPTGPLNNCLAAVDHQILRLTNWTRASVK